MKTNRFIANMSWLLFGRIFQMIIQFIIGILSARYLGPSNYGTISYVASYISFFVSFSMLGLNGVLINELVHHRDSEGGILGTAIVMRLVVALLSVVVLFIIIQSTDGTDSVIFTIAVLMSFQIPLTAFDTIGLWYQSQLLSKKTVIIQSVSYFITATYKVYLLVTRKSVEWFAFSATLDMTLVTIFYLVSYQKNKNIAMSVSLPIMKRMLKKCFPFLLANLMVQVYQQTDKIMIRHLLDSVERVGVYTACTIISGMLGFIPIALIDSGRPVVMELKATKSEKYELRMRQLIAGVMWISIIYSFFISVFATFVLGILYGPDYISGDNCLRIVVWYTAFSYLGGIRSIWLICEEKNNYVFLLSFMGALTNIALNVVLIPRFGINGAALATLLTQVLANLVYPSFFKSTRGFSVLAVNALLLRNVDFSKMIDFLKRNIKTIFGKNPEI
ncbi:MAG: flippase [Bacilli bacterium]